MPLYCDSELYSVVREEHLIHSDFFLRYLEFREEAEPSALILTCLSGGEVCREVRYSASEIAARFAYGRQELPRYRDSSLGRILGLAYRPETAFLHEHFAFFASAPVDALHISADCGGRRLEKDVRVIPYQSPNRYRFPLRGTVLVTDTYPSVNSHRWCRNSEYAFDAGRFDGTLLHSRIAGAPVYAACGGVVEEAFDGLEDTDTCLELVEQQYGEGFCRKRKLPVLSGIVPGVMAQTGMETAEILKGIIHETRPDLVIAIDALAARSIRRLGTTIQLTDTGIHPGSGVGNHRNSLTKESLGVPVLAIGVPTVVGTAAIVYDTVDTMIQTLNRHVSTRGMGNMMESMTAEEQYALICELLEPEFGSLYVTPPDIDERIGRLSFTVSEGIHEALYQ